MPAIAKFLKNDRSVRAKPGPRIASRAFVADLAGVGRQRQPLEAARVEPLRVVCGAPSFGSQVMFGRLVSDVSEMLFGSIDGQREAGLGLDDAVDLPAAERQPRRRALLVGSRGSS